MRQFRRKIKKQTKEENDRYDNEINSYYKLRHILSDRSINELISSIEARRESKRKNQNKEKKEQNKR